MICVLRAVLLSSWTRLDPSSACAYCVEVGEVISEVEGLAAVHSKLLTAWLEHVIATDVALQEKLRVAPAGRHILMYH